MWRKLKMWLTFHFLWGQCPECGERHGRIKNGRIRSEDVICSCGHKGPFIINSFVRCWKCRGLYTREDYRTLMAKESPNECPMCHAGFPDHKIFPEYFISPWQCFQQWLTGKYKIFLTWDCGVLPGPELFKDNPEAKEQHRKWWAALQKLQEAEGE